jgi:hypothetical protein
MFTRVVQIGLIASLFLILVGGSVYILASPTETREDSFAQAGSGYAVAERGRIESVVAQEENGGDEADQLQEENSADEADQLQAESAGGEYDQLGEGRGADSELAGQGLGTQSQWADAEEPAWEIIQGFANDTGHDLLVETGGGEVLVGLGPDFYREERSFTISEGDEVSVQGYHEDGEFKAGTVKNLTTGMEIVLRDAATGRPAWSGSGYNRNRS